MRGIEAGRPLGAAAIFTSARRVFGKPDNSPLRSLPMPRRCVDLYIFLENDVNDPPAFAQIEPFFPGLQRQGSAGRTRAVAIT